MMFKTSLTSLLSIEHPVILAPMGFVSGGALAGAVSAAGGFGIIGGGYAYPDWLEREFGAAGNHPVGCGFITWALAERPASLDVALSYHPMAIMLSFGDAAPFLPKIKKAGALTICQVQHLAQARTVLKEGADIIVAQGTEAGGHGGGRSTLPLVPAVVASIPQKSSHLATGKLRSRMRLRQPRKRQDCDPLPNKSCNRTESADPADCSAGARGLWRSLAITAGGDFHPAPRTSPPAATTRAFVMGTRFYVASESLAAAGAWSDRNPTTAINAPLAKPCNPFAPGM